jgi:hypothetical protein
MTNPVDADRRRFLETAAVALAAAPFATASAAEGASSPASANTARNSFAAIQQVDAGDLNVGYASGNDAI